MKQNRSIELVEKSSTENIFKPPYFESSIPSQFK